MDRYDPSSFPVRWEPTPAAREPEGAKGLQAFHAGRAENVMCRGLVRKGDPETALARTEVVAEGAFETRFIEHAYIEPEAGHADCQDGRIEVHGGTQAPHMNRESLADILGLPVEAIRIVPTAVGGGFGSKLDLSWQPHVALAAQALKRAVRIAYSRAE